MRSESVAAGLLTVGGLASLAGLLLVLWIRLGPRKPPTLPSPGPPEKLPAATQETPTPFAPLPVTPTPMATPTDKPGWTYDGIDLGWSEEKVVVAFSGVELLRPFEPYIWKPDLERDIFAVGSSHGLVWEDNSGRVGVWLHSGDNQVASPLQDYIERDVNGYLVTHEQADARLEDMRGTSVQVQQGPNLSRSIIAAAVRIPPLRVNDVETHVGDLVEYLAEHYPGTGFDVLHTETEAMMFYFCGLRLGGEDASKASYWTQARFVIAIVPEGE